MTVYSHEMFKLVPIDVLAFTIYKYPSQAVNHIIKHTMEGNDKERSNRISSRNTNHNKINASENAFEWATHS